MQKREQSKGENKAKERTKKESIVKTKYLVRARIPFFFRTSPFLSSNVSTDLYVILKRVGPILWPETAFIGPLTLWLPRYIAAYVDTRKTTSKTEDENNED